MSFHTLVWVHPFDGEPLAISSAQDEITTLLDERALSHDVLKNLFEACGSALPASSPTLFFLDSWSVADLFGEVARCLPHASFAVKGVGEEPRDIWVREYADGAATFEAGPFQE
ncbi:hypothetical protein PQR67_27015 [Paraburkholderia fungorum]|uniref:hypothetical protein n=1 Tax=Paraburkholderia fungorum TaxID=134537 RepID=UPI0038BBA856